MNKHQMTQSDWLVPGTTFHRTIYLSTNTVVTPAHKSLPCVPLPVARLCRYAGMEKWEELRKLLLDGARLLLSRGQTESGADLASLYIDVLAKSTADCDPETVANVAR